MTLIARHSWVVLRWRRQQVRLIEPPSRAHTPQQQQQEEETRSELLVYPRHVLCFHGRGPTTRDGDVLTTPGTPEDTWGHLGYRLGSETRFISEWSRCRPDGTMTPHGRSS
ncbi:unnamed protein product [Merluccius merluccius]